MGPGTVDRYMASQDLHFLTIAELVPLFRRGEVSPVELTEAVLERIDRLDGELRSYITVTEDRARVDAKSAEIALREGNDLGPLHGIPVALKDLCDTAGIRTTSGSKIRENFVPTTSSAVATKLARAGAVLLGKTNLVEFAFGPYGLNPHYGTPANPWDLERAPGGSSSGSGVSVSAGLATAAIGTDTGGSVRIPSAFCGIVGLKPTVGRVSTAGITPLSRTLDSVGPMTRCVEDAALVYTTIAGLDGEEPAPQSREGAEVLRSLKRDVKGMRTGVVRSPFFQNAEADVVALVDRAVKVLDGLGVRVDELDWPEAESVVEQGEGLLIMKAEGFAFHRESLAGQPQAFDPRVRVRLEEGAKIPAPDYVLALERQAKLKRSTQRRLEDLDAVVGPTVITQAPRVGEIRDGQPPKLTTRVVNVLGLCSISVPCGLTPEGMPVGLQIIGKSFDESKILRLAYAYEQSTDWHVRHPML